MSTQQETVSEEERHCGLMVVAACEKDISKFDLFLKELTSPLTFFVKEEFIPQVTELRKQYLTITYLVVIDQPRTVRDYVRQAMALNPDTTIPYFYAWSYGRQPFPESVPWCTLASTTSIYEIPECLVGHQDAWNLETRPVHTSLNQLFPPPRLATPPILNHSLSFLMELYGSDKGNESGDAKHHYTEFYDNLFSKMRHEPISLFELGTNYKSILNASCLAWQDYFTSGYIFGADTDTSARNPLTQGDRLRLVRCDKPSPESYQNLWNQPEIANVNFDIIIEGVYSVFYPSCLFFECSIHKLKKGGLYIIENIDRDNYDLFLNKMESWRLKYTHLDFKIVNLKPTNRWFFPEDNIVMVVSHK